jgi:putative sterol carrier protein
MPDATAEFFDDLGRRGHEPLLEKATGTMRFELTEGRRTDRWQVAIERGGLEVSRKNEKADCVARMDKALFDRVVTGRANALTAVLRGEMRLEGDTELLVLFQRLLPAPPTSRRGPASGRKR